MSCFTIRSRVLQRFFVRSPLAGCLICCGMLLLSGPQVRGADPPTAIESAKCIDVEALLESIRTAGLEAAPGPDASQDDIFNYWALVSDRTVEQGIKLTEVDAKQRKANLQCFVESFGRHGPQADFRLAIAFYPVTPMDWATRPQPTKDKWTRKWRDIQLDLSEIMVREFLKHPDMLHRYYQVVIWNDQGHGFKLSSFFRIQDLGKRLLGPERDKFAEEYWWYALQTLLLVHAVGQDHLLENVSPEHLDKALVEWSVWMAENGPYLRQNPDTRQWEVDEDNKADKSGYIGWSQLRILRPPPEMIVEPFPDWTGVPPPTPKVMHDLQ